jgi:hypothetical protein
MMAQTKNQNPTAGGVAGGASGRDMPNPAQLRLIDKLDRKIKMLFGENWKVFRRGKKYYAGFYEDELLGYYLSDEIYVDGNHFMLIDLDTGAKSGWYKINE